MAYEILDDAPKGRFEILPPDEATLTDKLKQGLGDLAAGAVRGAGSIGATLLTPVDAAAKALGISNSIIGRDDRRAGMDAGLRTMGADTESLPFAGGKLAAEIAGTSGIGGALAGGLSRLGVASPLLKAVETAGMTTGANMGRFADMGTRAAGGAINGALTAGAVDPSMTAEGAMIGGALPVALKGAGAIGNALRGNAAGASDQAMTAARAGAGAGYVIPPADLRPGMVSEAMNGLSGKIKTAQVASQRNQAVTDGLARKALGLPDDAVLSADLLNSIRQRAGGAYAPVKGAGMVNADAAFAKDLDSIASTYKSAGSSFPGLAKNEIESMVDSLRVGQFDAGGAVDAIKVLRDTADKAFRQGDTGMGKAAKGAAGALESQLERHLQAQGSTDALQALREARQEIAKTYSVQKGLNSQTGSVNAQKLAEQLRKGKPLSGDLLTIAQMAEAFPKATQMLKESPKTFSPLDFAVAATSGAATANPLAAMTMMARPMARSALLSGPVQRAALAPSRGLLSIDPEMMGLLSQGAYRASPLLANQ